MIAEHAVTRSVRDSAALLDATSGPDIGDPYMAPQPARPFIEEVGADPGRLRIAFTTATATGVPLDPDCIKAVQDAAALLSDLGHSVEEAAPQINGELLTQSFMGLWSAGAAWTIDGIAHELGRKPSAEDFEPLTWALYGMGSKRTASEYLLALQMLQLISRDVARFFEGYDVWLTPTLGEPPVALGTFDSTQENPIAGDDARDEPLFLSLRFATSRASLRCPSRCIGTKRACPWARILSRGSATRRRCLDWRRNSKRRAPGPIAARRSHKGDREASFL